MFKLGEKVSFGKHIKKASYGMDKEVSKEFCNICGLELKEDSRFIAEFFIPRTKWRGFKLDKPTTGIICGVRSIGAKVWYDGEYGAAGIEEYKQVYLVANKMSGFYYVLPEWLFSAE
jgi:hypothetical protein